MGVLLIINSRQLLTAKFESCEDKSPKTINETVKIVLWLPAALSQEGGVWACRPHLWPLCLLSCGKERSRSDVESVLRTKVKMLVSVYSHSVLVHRRA